MTITLMWMMNILWEIIFVCKAFNRCIIFVVTRSLIVLVLFMLQSSNTWIIYFLFTRSFFKILRVLIIWCYFISLSTITNFFLWSVNVFGDMTRFVKNWLLLRYFGYTVIIFVSTLVYLIITANFSLLLIIYILMSS